MQFVVDGQDTEGTRGCEASPLGDQTQADTRHSREAAAPETYSLGELMDISHEYLRDCKNREYRRMAKKGLLEGFTRERAEAAPAMAHILMGRGEGSGQSWSWAIRVELLESEMD